METNRCFANGEGRGGGPGRFEEASLIPSPDERIRDCIARHPDWDNHRVANAIAGSRVGMVAAIRGGSVTPAGPDVASLNAKIETQCRTIEALEKTLSLMTRRQRPYEVPVAGEGNLLRFAVIGDTQVGSLYQRLDALKAFYAHCEREGIADVLHAGDVIDGWRVYRGQEFELHPNAKSWPEQRDMFVAQAPRIDGITTHFITGNHDASFKNIVGLVAGDELAALRPDWKFVGQEVGLVTLKTKAGQRFAVELLHPGGGTAYAVSYQAQKIIEAIPGGQKPDLIVIGHYHKALYMPAYRNVECILAGCFQSQTPFMTRHSIAANIGGWIIEVTLGERRKLTSRVRAEFVSFYEEQR